jgi:lipoprotein-releasing system permease protein
MYRPLALFIGLRYAYGKNTDSFGRFVGWLSMIGLMLGAMALIIVLSIMNGLEGQMQASILRFFPQAILTTDKHRVDPTLYPATLFTNMPNVNHITSLVTSEAILQSPNAITVSQLIGINPEQFEPISQYISVGELADLQSGQYRIIIGRSMAEQLQVDIGDQVRVMVPSASQLTPMGRIPSQRLFTVAGIFHVNNDINVSLFYANQTDVAKLMHLPKDYITGWRLFLDHPLEIEQIVKQPLPENMMIKDWRESRGELFAAVKLEKKMMGLLISLIVIVAVFNIITSLGLFVMEKEGEVAILKTLGLSSQHIMRIFMVQGASSGIIGTVIGSLLGITIALNINFIMKYLGLSMAGIRLPATLEPTQIALIVFSLIAISILATVYPAWRAAKTQPAEALRYE